MEPTGIAILRDSDRHGQQWKNGGGVTREVAAYPPHAGIEDFEWRISIADIAGAGPFSHFEGVDRILTVIEGQLRLEPAQGPAVILGQVLEPYSFSGEMDIDGVPLSRIVRDVNVMVRRGRWRAEVNVLGSGDTAEDLADADTAALLALTPQTAHVGADAKALGMLDAMLLHRPGATKITAGGSALLARLWRLGPG